MHEKLFQTFERIMPLGENLKDYLRENTNVVEHKKKHLLLEDGKTCKNIYFINSGFARAFYVKDGKEVTSWLMGEGELIISVYSFFTQQPGAENIQMLEDSELIVLSYEQLQRSYQLFPEFNTIGRVLTEHYYMLSEERTIGMRMLTAKERYDNLVTKYPLILQHVSLGQIASYLGITQETLSRVRGK